MPFDENNQGGGGSGGNPHPLDPAVAMVILYAHAMGKRALVGDVDGSVEDVTITFRIKTIQNDDNAFFFQNLAMHIDRWEKIEFEEGNFDGT